ncbi:TetR/AcrR family transcriptional regulator [Rhodococcus sp. NPDC058521]|uniref:TetR/AcrR family transcriptional regulator n=1 Tax=Rhodococcus sp. NPDC058521 TaxID=3346536 RepID=UPI00365F9FDE
MQPNKEPKRSFIEESRRAQIVEATIAAIAEHGYTATTFTRIARHAAISAGLISYHFESKEDLMNVTLGTIERRLDTAMGDGPEPDSYPQALKSMLTRYVAYCTEHKQEMSALAQIRQQAPHPSRAGRDGADADELVQFISEGQSYGQFRDADPAVFASVLTNAMGHVPRELERRPEAEHEEFASQWSALFVNAISASEGDGS